jgi:acyl-CoA reductase-like NAD-dependent aldehyde dehydrogenase
VSHLDPNLLVALCTGCLSIAGAAIVAKINATSAREIAEMKEKSATDLAEKKDRSQQELVSYKIDRLAEKVEKHNGVVEKVAVLEHDMKTVWMRYDDLKGMIDGKRGAK